MAEPRKIVQGGLKALEAATKAVDAEDAAAKAARMAALIESERALPLRLARAPAKSKSEIASHAERVGRQMLGEHITSGKPGKTANLAGRSKRESERVKNIEYEIVPTKDVPASQVHESQIGDINVAFPGDYTLSDVELKSLQGVPIGSKQEGGSRFGLGKLDMEEPLFWASNEGPAQLAQDKATDVFQLYEPNRVMAHHLAMGRTANNFAQHFADASLRAIDYSNLTPKDMNLFDSIIAGGYTKKNQKTGKLEDITFPHWPGIADPESALAAMKADPELRKWFLNRMKTPSVTEATKMPNGLDIEWAITSPDLRNLEVNLTGHSVGQLVPGAKLTDTANHQTYSKGIQGRYMGHQGALTPFVISFPDAAQHIASTQRPQDFTGTIQKVFPHQIVDQQYLDELGEYKRQLDRVLTGKKKGGPVKESEKDMAEFQKRFALHKATGGKVNIPHLTLKKADGGKIAKSLMGAINKASKAVDAEAAGAKALTAAERDANKAKFLSDSVVKERLYHGTKNDIKSFDLSKRGNSDISSVGGGVYLTPEPSVASFYSKIVPGESGANVMPVYAQVKNPFEYDLAMPFKSQKDSNEFSRKLQEAGYDSIIKRDKDGQISELVVFEPNKIKSAISNRGTYDTKDPDITKADGGAVQHDSLKDLEEFHRRFALHKATGGKANIPHLSLKRVKKFDGGGIAAADVGAGVEDKGSTRGARIAEKLYEMAKEQGKEEVSSLKKPRALTDLLNRGVLANNPVSAGVDLVNMGLGGIDTAINAMRSPTMGELVTGKQDKKYLSSEKPFLGSEHIKDLMNKYGVTSGEERPLMETALSFASPTAVIKGAQKTADVAKKAPEMVQRATDAFTSSKLSPLATEAKTASAGKPTGATYATKQEGPFFRVRPTSLDQSTAKGRGIREADELQGTTSVGGGAGSSGSTVPTRLSDEEVARIIADPAANEPLNIAKKYTQETQGAEFTLPEIPESSLVKQSAIGRAHQLAVEGTPEYKSSVFDAYAREMPEVLEQAGAKNYDDLMEKAYRQLAKETDAQFQALPYNFSYHRAGEGNYQSSKEMAADVHGNKHLYVFQGGDPHDFLNRIDPVTGLNENEKFRAVHDLLGHAIYGNQFGPKGEEVAWAIHSQMYSPLARLAMTAETRGQNSMVNYSPLNAALKAEIAKYDSLASEARRRGDTALLNEINAAKRQAYSGFQYAPQKAVLLPPEFLDPKYAGGMPSYLEAANRPTKGTETQSVLTHFSHNPELQFVDPKRYGTGIKGAEAERLRDFPGGVRDRSYFYMGEPGAVKPEPGLGVNRYRGEASSLYDITQDPLNFRVLARESNRVPYTAKYNQGITSPLQEANDMERLVKEYGYQGMANPKASKPMAIMFKETPVRREARGGLTLMK